MTGRVSLEDVVKAPARPRRPVVEVRTMTVDLPSDLIREVKAHCVDNDLRIKDFVADALRWSLTENSM